MPFCHLGYGPLAIRTARWKEAMVVFVTVCLSIPFKESRCAQLCFTNPTHKVLRVPHFTQCSDHLEKGNDDRNDSHVVEISQKSNEIKKKIFTWQYLDTLSNSWLVPFPQWICGRKRSDLWLQCEHQSSPCQSSVPPAGHRLNLWWYVCLMPFHQNPLHCCSSPSPVAFLLVSLSQTSSGSVVEVLSGLMDPFL